MSLRCKYTYCIQTAEQRWTGGSVEEKDGKLYLKGNVATMDDVNAIWNALKTIPDSHQDIVADIKATNPAPVAASAASDRTYTVHSGDTLSKIAQRELGDARK